MVAQASIRVWTACFAFGVGIAMAQQGGIRGMAMDADFEVPLPGVKVLVSETGQETVTGDAGSYVFESLEPGAYTLLFSKSGYTRATQPNIVVSPGQLAEASVEMAGEYEEMDELVVRDIQLGGASEIGLLNLRMESVAMMDSVGSELLSQAGASDAAQALKLIPGTSIQDGKYATVRGLPDRYVVSLMNGVRLPTADADKRAVQLDQFPSDVIESVQVTKTFTPDQQGDATGGAVDIVLKSIPQEPVLKVSVGMEINEQVLEAHDNFLSYQGGGVSYFGKDDGGRDLPVKAANAIYHAQPGFTDAQKQAQTDLFKPVVGVGRTEVDPIYHKWAVTAGNKHRFESGLKVGALANVNYGNDASYYEDGELREYEVKLQGGEKKLLPAIKKDVAATRLYDVVRGEQEVQWSTLGIVGAEYNEQEIQLLYMLTHVATDTAQLLEDREGFDVWKPTGGEYEEIEYYSREHTLDYKERSTSTLQLSGHHVLPVPEYGLGDIVRTLEPELDWRLSRSSSRLYQPDTRFFSSHWRVGRDLYRGEDPSGNGIAQRLWKDIEEVSSQYALNGVLPFEQWTGTRGEIKLGVFSDAVDRTYEQDSFRYSEHPNFLAGAPFEDYWSDVYTAQGGYVLNSGSDIHYDGDASIDAMYWMGDVPLWSFVNLIGGVRYEGTEIATRNKIVGGPDDRYIYTRDNQWEFVDASTIADKADASLVQDDVLPSLGLVVRPLEGITLRASYAETVARPTFKELSPIAQVAYSGGDIFVGNPDLQMVNTKNQDLRVEWAPYPGGLVSGSWFHKDLENPIERVAAFNTGQRFTTVQNYSEGRIDGCELELRQQLGSLWEPLEGLGAGFNFTQMDSEVEVPRNEVDRGSPATRDMLDTPDILYNVFATLDIERFGTKAGLFYSYAGEKLVEGATFIGREIPNVYELGYGTLNFTVSQAIGEHWSVSFKVKNLTDTERKQVWRASGVAGEETYKSYRSGRDYSIGVTATW